MNTHEKEKKNLNSVEKNPISIEGENSEIQTSELEKSLLQENQKKDREIAEINQKYETALYSLARETEKVDRAERLFEDKIFLIKKGFFLRYIEAIEQLKRAVFFIKKANDKQFENYLFGLEIILSDMNKYLEDQGLEKTKIEIGQDTWASNLHKVETTSFAKDIPELVIMEVFEDGWIYQGRVIKLAKVRINKNLKTEEK